MSVALSLTKEEAVELAVHLEDHAQLEPENRTIQTINRKLRRLMGLAADQSRETS